MSADRDAALSSSIVATTADWTSPLNDEHYAATYEAVKTLSVLRDMDMSTGAPPRREGMSLNSACLCSKYGFDDARYPAKVSALSNEWYGKRTPILDVVWQSVLWDLVHEYLLPVIRQATAAAGRPEQAEQIALYRLPTLHNNPVRAHNPLLVMIAPTRVYVPWIDVFARTVLAIDAHRNGTQHA